MYIGLKKVVDFHGLFKSTSPSRSLNMQFRKLFQEKRDKVIANSEKELKQKMKKRVQRG